MPAPKLSKPSDSEPLDTGRAIHAARVRKGLTLQQLADRAGCGKSYLSQLENGHKSGSGVAHGLLARIERALDLSAGELVFVSQWQATPGPVRREVKRVEAGRRAAAEQLRELLRAGAHAPLDELHRSGELRELVDRLAGDGLGEREGGGRMPGGELDLVGAAVEVPLINSVAAGYPTDFTDLGYPARVADEYVRVPDVRDPDAFAARVVGDSMLPDYREGDIVVFSPMRDLRDGMDCFVRLEPDHQSTFKRVFFETGEKAHSSKFKAQSSEGEDAGAMSAESRAALGGESGGEMCGEMIRLQPLNPKYTPIVVPRENVAGLYAAVSVTRMV